MDLQGGVKGGRFPIEKVSGYSCFHLYVIRQHHSNMLYVFEHLFSQILKLKWLIECIPVV